MFDIIKAQFAHLARRMLGVFPTKARPVLAPAETAVVFFAGQALETAVADSARLIMTGQAQSQGFSQAAFKNAVCAKIFGLFDCQNGVYVDVKTFASFGNVTVGLGYHWPIIGFACAVIIALTARRPASRT